MTDYVPRSTRQHIEGEIWKDQVVDYLQSISLYSEAEDETAQRVADKALYFNKDEGGELMEMDARVFMKSWIRELLEE